MPFVALLLLSGIGSYAGKKIADYQDENKQNSEIQKIEIPVKKQAMSTQNMVGIAIGAGVVLALLTKKGK